MKDKIYVCTYIDNSLMEANTKNYIISSVMHAFWLVLTHDLLEDRRINDVIIKTFFNSLLYKTNRFQVAVRLFSNRSQRTSKCGKNISDTLGCASCATFLFLPHFDFICDVLLYRRTATWNLFVNWITGRSQTSWLYTKRKLRTNPESVRVEGLNQELPDYKTSALNTRPLCLS